MLCPRCLASGFWVAMVPAAGMTGFWQCPQYRSHEFVEDATMDKQQDRASGRNRVETEPRRVEQLQRCPKCNAPLRRDDLGPYCDSAVHKGVYRVPKEHWLAHIGITVPLPEVRQASSPVDGVNCQGVGSLGHGGGGGSGRKRKKPQKRRPGDRNFFDN